MMAPPYLDRRMAQATGGGGAHVSETPLAFRAVTMRGLVIAAGCAGLGSHRLHRWPALLCPASITIASEWQPASSALAGASDGRLSGRWSQSEAQLPHNPAGTASGMVSVAEMGGPAAWLGQFRGRRQ
jgi:hypothetical protein